MKPDNIRVTYMPHPFSMDREITITSYDTYRNIFNSLGSPLDISHAIIVDKDNRIYSDALDDYPKTDEIIIRMVPEGEGGNSEELKSAGIASKWTGAGLTTLGVILLFVPGAQGFGVSLIASGVTTFAAGVVLYNTDIDVPTSASSGSNSQTQSLKSSKNSNRLGGRIPILLGEYLIAPDNGAYPYVTAEENDQYLHQIFVAGFNDVIIDESTFKIGNVLTTQYDGFEAPNVEYDDTIHAFYPKRIIGEFVSSLLDFYDPDEGETDDDVTVESTTATKVKAITISLLFPNGLYMLEGNDDTLHHDVMQIKYEYKNSNDPDTSYISFYPTMTKPSNVTKANNFQIVAETDEATRIEAYYDFGNPISADTQYTIRLRNKKEVRDSDDWTYPTTMYWETLASHVVSYPIVTDGDLPIIPTVQAKLTTISIKAKATDTFSGTVDELNCMANLNTYDYDGSASGLASAWSTKSHTNNPASMFLYVLQNSHVNPHPVADAQIDWASLEEWWDFCDVGDNSQSYECNAYINYEMTLSEILNSICSCARASWGMIDGKYTIIVDTVKSDVTQFFTPRNSWNFSASKQFPDPITELDMVYVNEDTWEEDERVVYYDEEDDTTSQTVDLFGVTNAIQAWNIGRYMMNATYLRPEIFSFDVDVEYIVCTRGDRIQINHDVPLYGLQAGRINIVNESGGTTLGFYSDELLRYEVGELYGVTIRFSDGTATTYDIVNPATSSDIESDEITFVTPIGSISVLNVDDLFMYGTRGSETADLIVTSISPKDDLSATITAVDYSSAIFTLGEAPVYSPNMSVAGNGSVNVTITNVPNAEAVLQESFNNSGTAIALSTYSLSSKRPDSYAVTSSSGFYIEFMDDNYFVYSNMDDNGLLYRKEKTRVYDGDAISTVRGACPASDKAGKLVYVNQDDGSTLYYKNDDDVLTGTQLTTVQSWCPTFLNDVNTTDIYYINVEDDYKLYKTTTSGGNGTAVTTFSIRWMAYVNSYNIVYSKMESTGMYVKSIEDDTEGDLFYSYGVDKFSMISYNTIAFIKSDDRIVYEKEILVGAPTNDGTPLFIGAVGIGCNEGDIVYGGSFNNNYLYIALSTRDVSGAYLESSEYLYEITGNIFAGSTIVTTVSVNDLDVIVKGDNIYGTGIPDGTIVTLKGPTYFYISNSATVTTDSETLGVGGTRIFLDANKVIVKGTIGANLLEASAINSKARADDGNYITDKNLDTGVEQIRKQDGTVVWDFDPSRSGSELELDGTISFAYDIDDDTITTDKIKTGQVALQSSSFVSGASGEGWQILTDGTAEFHEITVQKFPDKLGSDVTITVGAGGDYTTINEALVYLSSAYPIYTQGGFSATISLLSGFVMGEQVLVDGLNLGWITITGVDSSTTIDSDSMRIAFASGEPTFGCINGGTLPTIDQLFTFDTPASTSYTYIGLECYGAGSGATILSGAGFTNSDQYGVMVSNGASLLAYGSIFSGNKRYGISCSGGKVVAIACTITACGYGRYTTSYGASITNGGSAELQSSNFTGCERYGLYVGNGASCSATSVNVSSCSVGIYATGASTIAANSAIASGCSTGIYSEYGSTISFNVGNASLCISRGIYALYGGKISGYNISARKTTGVDSTTDIVITRGGIISCYSATGGVSTTINTVSVDGIIFR